MKPEVTHYRYSESNPWELWRPPYRPTQSIYALRFADGSEWTIESGWREPPPTVIDGTGWAEAAFEDGLFAQIRWFDPKNLYSLTR